VCNAAAHPGPGVIQSTPENPSYHFGTAAPERMTVVSGALVGGFNVAIFCCCLFALKTKSLKP
jgi:hypothetical protein